MHDDPARRRQRPTEAAIPPQPDCEAPGESARGHGAGTPDAADAYFRTILEHASDIILVIDRAGAITYASPSVERFLGYRPAELIGTKALRLIVPDDRARANADFNHALQTSATPLPSVFRVRHKGGAVRTLEGVGKNLLTDPVVAGFVMNISDVTELYHTRVRQRETAERLQLLFDANPTGLWLVHARTRTIASANPAALLMMDRSEAEVLGQACHRFICPEGLHGCPVLDQNLPVDRSERVLVTRGGQRLTIMKTVVPVTIGDEPYLLESFIDLTEHKRAQREVQQSREAAERLAGELELLARIGRVVSSTLELDQILERFAAEVRKRIPFDRFAVNLCDPDREIIRVAHVSGVAIDDRREGESHPLEGTLSAEVLRTRTGVLIQPENPDELLRRFPRIGRTLEAGLRSLMAVPLLYRDHPIGVLHFRSKNRNAYRPSDLRLAERIGTQAAGAIANAEAFGRLAETEKALRASAENLRMAFGTTVQVMAAAVEAKDPYTAGHQLRTADLARAIATEMGVSPDIIEGIRMAGTIHDIGKLSIPAEILAKPTKLSGLEFSLIQEHCRKGFEMLQDVASPWPLAGIVLQHHERIDGSGYPEGLKGDEILLEARILTVADVVEAMASHRPYRPGLGVDAALHEIETHAGTFYDSGAVAACLRLFREKGFQLC